MKTVWPVVCLIATAIITQRACAQGTDSFNEVVKANNAFSLRLYRTLASEPGNQCSSPFQIHSTLAAVHAGAKGKTASQIAKVLELPDQSTRNATHCSALLQNMRASSTPDIKLELASAMFLQTGETFSQPFKELLVKHYDTSLVLMDLTGWPTEFNPEKAMTARKQINSWVANQTHDRITNIVPASLLDEFTRLILVNTLWFKGRWATPFQKSETRNAMFQLSSKDTVLVPTMRLTAEFSCMESKHFQVLEIPYASNQMAMVIILPKENVGLPEIEKSLTSAQLEKFQHSMRFREVRLSLPRFQVTSGYQLEKPLEKMGMKDVFSPQLADLSGITALKPFFIKTILQKTWIAADESGTEAATGVVVAGDTLGIPYVFSVDHPFIFFVRDNRTGCILFLGRVVDPSKE